MVIKIYQVITNVNVKINNYKKLTVSCLNESANPYCK